MSELHASHRWDEGPPPVCLDCRVEGYEDEPGAFRPCPGRKRKAVCWATLDSTYVPGHTHLCELSPHEGDHICDECRRRFGTA